ncbi:YbaB/EbfC family nucleoid-associated protein [Gordonia sp. CPCC 205333]|uniref:YbaB/EbfC family nucleoid-associated protein n=1 Tax=Gordonia sp. CPCC 205333 TaxID=3140790 RepID=UPI003AF33756
MNQPFDPSELFGGGAGGDNPMAGLLAQAQQMQEQLLAAQNEITAAEVTGTAGNGLVSVTGTGGGDITAITIDPKVIDPDDAETLQDLVLGALADLATKRDALAQEKMGPLAGGLGGGLGGGLPGLG